MFNIMSTISDIPVAESDDDMKSPERKKTRGDEDRGDLDKSQLAMVDLLMTKMGTLMEDKLTKHEKRAQRKIDHLQGQVRAVAKATLDGLNELKKDSEEAKKDIKVLQEAMSKMNANSITKTDTDGNERDTQVIVSGFEIDSDADEVINTINKFLDVGTRRAKVVKVSTFSDPTSIGVISFQSIPAKIGFYKKIKNHDYKLENGRVLNFSNNEAFEVRVRNKRLGQIKFQINRHLEYKLSDIHIDRDRGVVRVKGEKGDIEAAWFNNEGNLCYDESIEIIKAAVDEWWGMFKNKKQIKAD